MTIMLDPRSGSGELLPYFKPYDVPIEVTQLDAADACFCGNGKDGPVLIGYERKVLSDLIQSMRTERFAGEQLDKLVKQYQYITIIVEGIWRAGPETGAVEVKVYKNGKSVWEPIRVGPRSVMYREVDHWLATLEHVVDDGIPFNVVRTADAAQTCAYLVSRYKWWNNKEWSEHNSFKAIYSPDVPNKPGRQGFSTVQPGPVEEVSSRFPGVREKAWQFGKRFESVWQMVNASERELAEVDGIGKKGAKNIWGWIREKHATEFRPAPRGGWDSNE